MGKKQTLEERVEQLKQEAAEKGLLNNLLFEELLDDFAYQTSLMKRLRDRIDSEDVTTEKTYIKGKPNESPNKLIATYNATSNARANTVTTLKKILLTFEDKSKNKDPLAGLMNGGGVDE